VKTAAGSEEKLMTKSNRVNPSASQAEQLAPIGEMVRACIQCGTCTGSCPNAFAMDHTPRKMWRMVLMGLKDEIFNSRTFALCSACYCCTLRCPRGLPLTDAMGALKQMAARERPDFQRSSLLFYRSFIQSVRRHGRVNEMEMMAYYFAGLRRPGVPLRYTPLGVRLMGKRKVSMFLPSRGKRPLEGLFQKVEEMERQQ
jgi:heterodisulfide reductase subunit C